VFAVELIELIDTAAVAAVSVMPPLQPFALTLVVDVLRDDDH